MADQVGDMLLPESLSADYETDASLNRISNLRRLNVFFGPNNCGKSRLLRGMFSEGRKLMVANSNDVDSNELLKIQDWFLGFDEVTIQKLNDGRLNGLIDMMNEKVLPFCSMDRGRPRFDVKEFDSEITARFQRVAEQRRNDPGFQEAIEHMRRLQRFLKPKQGESSNGAKTGDQWSFKDSVFVYIPTMRGLRKPIAAESAYFYRDRTYNDYFAKQPRFKGSDTEKAVLNQKSLGFENAEIVTGLELFETIRTYLLGTLQQRKLVAAYEQYLGESFFNCQPVALIPREGDDVLHVKIGREKERPIYSLGDGIQQMITMTFPMHFHQNRYLMLFIEEPDLHLHPGFQRLLIQTMLSSSSGQRQVFVTTHSQEFLDITISENDCSVFGFKKMQSTDSDHEHEPRFSISRALRGDFELLRDIGVRPSSVMLANCTIWVEGITDRLYMARYLNLFIAEKSASFAENLHYAFVEYSGSNVTHWSFLTGDEGMKAERTCATLFLISDRDSKKEERHAKLANNLGERFYCLNVREIENLLSPKVIAAVVQSYEGEGCELKSFEQEKYASKYLGTFIEKHILKDVTLSKRLSDKGNPYAEKTSDSTLKNKPEFCRRALDHINSLDDMTEEEIKLTSLVFDFIRKQNR